MKRKSLLLFLLMLALTQSSKVLSHSGRIINQPSITIEQAIAKAKNYAVAKNVDTSKHYIDSVKLKQNPQGNGKEFWEVRWEESQFTCKGCFIVIYVYMDGAAAHVPAK